MFNQKHGQDAGTILVTIPLSTRRIVTNARFLDLMMEPVKVPCPLQKLNHIRIEDYREQWLQDDPFWDRWLHDPDLELEAIQEVLNSTSNKNNHVNTLLEPTLAIIDPDLIRNLALQRNVQIVAVETMNSVL